MKYPTNDSQDKEVKSNKFSKKRPKRRNNKGQAPRRYEEKDKVESTNDPAWYSQSPELLRDSASIPFSWPVGTRINSSSHMYRDVVPGICVLNVQPTVGTSLNENSPINVASSAIYSWVRHANSGHANYDAPDLMMYLLAMSNVYSFVVWMQRLYGIVRMYDQRNRYMPKALCYGMYVDFEDIRDNLANFRYFINVFINKVASLAVPNNMPIFRRLAFLCANVYIEGPSVKDQMYIYNQRGWYKFGINGDTGAGELVLNVMPSGDTGTKFSDITTYANDLFNAIWEQEDFGIMSGDILKAYQGDVIKLSPIPEDYVLQPIYDAMVLHQMKNARQLYHATVSKIGQNADGLITQSIAYDGDTSARIQAVYNAYVNQNKILSTDFAEPTPEVVIESTRLMWGYNKYDGVIYAGSEVLGQTIYVTFNNDMTLARVGQPVADWDDQTSVTPDTLITGFLPTFQIISGFKYHPEYELLITHGNAMAATPKSFRLWDIDNYAVLDNADIQKMNEAALMSLFAVPSVAKIQ